MRDDSSSQWWLHWLTMGWMPRGVALIPQVGTLVHEARNRIVEEALALDDWQTLVMLDADVFPPPHEECPLDALDLIQSYEANQIPVAGPFCYGRSMTQPTPVAGYFSSEVAYERLTAEEHDQMETEPGLHPVDVLGLGLVCFQRHVFEDLEPPWFANPVVEGRVLGEDHYLYRRLKEAGIPVYLDTRWHALHLGQLFYGKRTYQLWRDMAGEDSQRRSSSAAEATHRGR